MIAPPKTLPASFHAISFQRLGVAERRMHDAPLPILKPYFRCKLFLPLLVQVQAGHQVQDAPRQRVLLHHQRRGPLLGRERGHDGPVCQALGGCAQRDAVPRKHLP